MPARDVLGRIVFSSALIVFPLWVMLAFQWPTQTDLLFYANILRAFSAQLWAGDWYPRWLMDANGGFGSPVFLFYSPLPFYLMSLLEWLKPLDPYGFGRILIGIQAALVVMGAGCYQWLAAWCKPKAACQGALLYAGFPYVIALIYFSFPIGQLWALAIFPFLLKSADDLAQHGWKAFPAHSMAYALLCLAHLPSFIVLAPVAFCYALFRTRGFAYAVLSSLLGMGMAAVYWLPAAASREYIQSMEFITGQFVFSNNYYHIQSAFGLLLLLLPLVGIYCELSRDMKRQSFPPHLRFWLVMMAVLLYFMLPISEPLWKLLPPLQYLQFPYRFFLAMLAPAALFAALWLPHARSRRIYGQLSACMLALAAFLTFDTMFVSSLDRRLSGPDGTSLPLKEILDTQRIHPAEYQTRWMYQSGITAMGISDAMLAMPRASMKGAGRLQVAEWHPRTLALHAEMHGGGVVSLRQFYFPGWEANDPRVTVEERESLLAVRLPKGGGDYMLSLAWFPGERAGACISLAAFTLWCMIALAARSRWKYTS